MLTELYLTWELRSRFFSVSVSLAFLLVCCFLFPSAAAVAVLLQLPLVASHAGVAEAACGAVWNLAADNAENKAKLGTAGACEGGYPA